MTERPPEGDPDQVLAPPRGADPVSVVLGLLDDMGTPAYLADGPRLVRVNHTFAQLVERSPRELTDPAFDARSLWARDSLPSLEQRLSQIREIDPPPSRFQVALVNARGAEIPVEGASAPVTFEGRVCRIGILRDLGARRQRTAAQRELARSERSAAVGSLADGMSHHLKTPLTSLQTNAYMLISRLERAQANGAGLAREVGLARDLVKDIDRMHATLLDLERFAQHVDVTRMASLQRVVADAMVSLLASQRWNVPIEISLEPTPDTWMDVAQIKQVVLQLVQNAIEASRDTERPVGVRTTVRQSEEGAVCLIVQDEGEGIGPEVQGRMFEPLFSTWPGRQGLGLAIVRRIVDAHHGTIEVESEPGQGTRVTVRLPVPAEG